jgi:YaiO family outer membrane protein
MPVAAQVPPSPPPVSIPAQPAATPSFDDAYARARALANEGRPELALAAYDVLLARAPGNVDVLLGRGIVHARLGHWQDAERDLRAAAAASPDYADVWSALGNTYAWSDRPAHAVDAYTRLIALRPADPAALVARGRALRALGRNGEARADLDKARTLGAGGADFDALAATLQPRAGNPDSALAAGYTWAASVGSSWTDVGTGPGWNDQTVAVRHYTKAGSLAFETLRAHRFGRHDYAWALDGYVNLWPGAYANVRYQRGPAARLFPANAGRAELYQALGNGWEASVSDDVLGFPTRVNIYGVGIAKYMGDWYVQLRHQNIVSAGSHGTGDRLLARWYYAGDADTYAEAAINSGRSDDPLSLVGGRSRSGGGSVTWVRYWTPAWGTRVGASLSRAGGSADQRGVSVALYRRW